MIRSIAVATLMTGALLAQSGGAPAGHYEGAIQTPEGNLDVQIDLVKDSGTGWKGTISIPAQITKGLGLIDVAVKDNTVSFGIKALGDPRFRGTLSKDGGKISGEMTQSGYSMPFQLTRTGEAKIEKQALNPPMSKDLEGVWEGVLEAGGQQLRLRFVLSNENGAGTGKLFSLDQGNLEFPVARISQSGSKVKLEAPMIGAGFEGDLKAAKMTGEWSQGGASFPLTLAKAEK